MNWTKANCVVCGREFEYPAGFKSKTCSDFSCTWSYLHNPDKYKSLWQRLDESRDKAGI